MRRARTSALVGPDGGPVSSIAGAMAVALAFAPAQMLHMMSHVRESELRR